jgi:hypothetical protein
MQGLGNSLAQAEKDGLARTTTWTTEVGKNVGRIAGAPNRDLSTGAFPME